MEKSIPKPSEGTDKSELLKYRCKKYPSHEEFINVNDFDINHLSEEYRDIDIIDFTRAAADLTLRIEVTKDTLDRPNLFPNRQLPYSLSRLRFENARWVGTGRVYDVQKSNLQTLRCPCLKCKKSGKPSKMFGEIKVITACLIISDDNEAKNAVCRLFYDREDSPLVELTGFTTIETDVKFDKCLMGFITCDMGLIDKLGKMVERFTRLSTQIHHKYKRNRDNSKIAIVVSHPHGVPKQITIGRWIDKLNENENGEIQFTYTTPTCPGSSGATVHLIGYKVENDSPHLHSGGNSEGFNFSTIGKIHDSNATTATNDEKAAKKFKLSIGNDEILSGLIVKSHSQYSAVVNQIKIEIWTTDLKNEDTGEMESREKATIQTNYTYLIDELKNNHLVPYLFERKIISSDEKNEIEREQISHKRVALMLDKVMNACPDALFVFLDALEEHHPHVAEKLKETYNSF